VLTAKEKYRCYRGLLQRSSAARFKRIGNSNYVTPVNMKKLHTSFASATNKGDAKRFTVPNMVIYPVANNHRFLSLINNLI
jgi:hypothetical protein